MSFRFRCVRVGSAFFGMMKRSMWAVVPLSEPCAFSMCNTTNPIYGFPFFLACETMIDYYSARLLPLSWESPERCNLFGLLGNFQRYVVLRLGKFPNKLWYFPLANIRAVASVPTPYIFSPRFFGGCTIRLADWTCCFCFIGSTDWNKGLPHR